MSKLLDSQTAAKLRADLAAAQKPAPERTFIDDIRALEKAFDALLEVLENAR